MISPPTPNVLRRNAPRLLALLFLAATLSACVTTAQRTAGQLRGADELRPPLSIGPEPHELKRSPCACIRVPLLAPPVV